MADDDALWNSFVTPPPAAKPRVWWHWMNGNVDEEGIRRDLDWMARVGIGGAQVFEGGMNTPQMVTNRLVFDSPEWRRALRTAAAEADKLGLELTVATSGGWSAAGGPWVDPADAMRKLVWSEVVVDGGPCRVQLPPLPDIAGRYQDAPRWGTPSDPRAAWDICVLAIPATPDPLLPHAARADGNPVDASALVDGSFADGLTLHRDPQAHSEAFLEYDFGAAVTARSVTIGLPGPRGFGSPPPVHATLECSDDGETWREVLAMPSPQTAFLFRAMAPVVSRNFPATTARWFRLRLEGAPASSAVPPMDAGVLPLPFPPPAPGVLVTQFALRAGGRVHAAEDKAGFGIALDDRALDGPAEDGIPLEQVIDVSAHVVDGVLDWVAPSGRWRILRLGSSLTGHQNAPAPVEATGLEIDKLDPARVEAYLEHWLGIIRGAVGPDLIGERGIRSLMSDSIESGPQNWTDALPAEFARRRGYALLPWLPAMAGYVVVDSVTTDRVLADVRRTIAELVAESYYGTVARVAHRWGLTHYAEALEDHRPQLGDDLAMRSRVDIPMGAMWMFADAPNPTYVADLRGASSVAHVWGKAFTGAESMSAFGHPFVYTPRDLKPIVDLEFALGVTRICVHTSPHQPSEVRAPGIALSPHLGQTFTRHESWAEQAEPWVRYLARMSHLGALGSPVVDVAVLASDGDPITAVYGYDEFDALPEGFAFDFVNPEALEHALRVEDGALVSLGGARYRLLLLAGWTERLTLATVRRIRRLVDAGATVVGPAPVASPSAADEPEAFAAEVAELWASDRVHPELTRELLGTPDVLAPGLRVVHRRTDEADVYLFLNPRAEAVRLDATLRDAADGAEWWDPVSGARRAADARRAAGHTVVTIELPASGSGALVLRAPQSVPVVGVESVVDTVTPRTTDDASKVTTSWMASVTVPSGAATDARLFVRLANPHGVAEVLVDGTPAGIAWTAPFEVDATGLLTEGAHDIEVRVTTGWANRLILDAADPENATTQLTAPIYSSDTPLRPWGLDGGLDIVRRLVTDGDSRVR